MTLDSGPKKAAHVKQAALNLGNYSRMSILRGVRDRAHSGDAADRDCRALREARGIRLVRDRVERLDVGGRPDQLGEGHRGDAVLEVVLVSAGRQLAGVVEYRLVLGVRADLLEGRDRHGGQETDDDDDDHDFNKGETLGTVASDFHLMPICLFYVSL